MATTNLYIQPSVTDPNDIKTSEIQRAYRGMSTVSTGTDSWTLYDNELIKQDLINHFHIRKGEKLSNPNFGTIIWDVIYEAMTDNLKSAIIDDVSTIVNYDPRLRVEDIVVEEYYNGIQVECSVIFLPFNVSETMQFNFDKELGLTY